MSIKAMKQALERIASWSEHPAMLGVDYGSNGVRDYYRKIARDALTRTSIQQAEAQQPVTGEPVQADSSEHLRVIASLGAALRRLSFAAQTTGGTAGPDAELQSAIGQAEQALSLGGIGQAMFATPEPVASVPVADERAAKLDAECNSLAHQLNASNERNGRLRAALSDCSAELFAQCGDQSRAMSYVNAARAALAQNAPMVATPEPVVDVRCEGCGYMTHHREHMGCVRAAKQHTHPAPGVPDDVARDAERYRWLRSLEHCNEAWCFIGSSNANSNLDAAIDAAMLASTAQKGGE